MTNAHRHTGWVQNNPTYRPYLDGLWGSVLMDGRQVAIIIWKQPGMLNLMGFFLCLNFIELKEIEVTFSYDTLSFQAQQRAFLNLLELTKSI